MKKIYIIILMFLAIFLNIDGVRADDTNGPYEKTCTLMNKQYSDQYKDICTYRCSITVSDEISENKTTENYFEFNFKMIKKADYSIDYVIEPLKSSRNGTFSILFGPLKETTVEFEDGSKTTITPEDNITYMMPDSYYEREDYLKCPKIKTKITIVHGAASSSGDEQYYIRQYEFHPLEDQGTGNVEIPGEDGNYCFIFGDNLTPLIKWGLGIIRIAVALIFVVMTILDFLKLAGTGEEKNYKDALNKFIKRLIIVVLIEVLPVIISILIDISGILEQYNIQGDIFCSLF